MRRTSLCAMMVSRADASIYGFKPILIILSNVSAADLVWRVERTRCPVRDAAVAVLRVSRSRISHTIIISGSCLKQALSPDSNVTQFLSSISDWTTHSSSYSIGSSRVIIFFSREFSLFSIVYRVVVLPDPVGHVTSTIPAFLETALFNILFDVQKNHKSSKSITAFCESSIRHTIFSP